MQAIRPYAKEELQSLRRANLQNLCKIHNIKGANAKTDVLIDLLTDFYASPGYLTSTAYTKYQAAVAEAEAARRPSSSLSKSHPTTVPARAVVKPRIPPASGHATHAPGAVARRVVTKPQPPTTASATAAAGRPRVPTGTDGAKTAPVPKRPTQTPVDRTENDGHGKTTGEGQVDEKILEAIKQREAALEQREACLKQREEELHAAWARLRAVFEQHVGELPEALISEPFLQPLAPFNVQRDAATPVSPPDMPASSTRSSARLGKRHTRSTPRASADDDDEDADLPSSRRPAKLPRRASLIRTPKTQTPTGIDGPAQLLGSPHTPPASSARAGRGVLPPDFTVQPPSSSNQSAAAVPPTAHASGRGPETPTPRTPSPGHQGVTADNSMTPAVVSGDFFANPPGLYESGKKRARSTPDLPYPIFATAPRPTEPQSPTNGIHGPARTTGDGTAMLTPGRAPPPPAALPRRAGGADPTPRKVSKAHLDLTTITETTEDPHARAESPIDAPTPASILGPELARARTTTPPALSPSPSIGGDNFTYTPLPRPPASSAAMAAMANAASSNSNPNAAARARSRALNSSSPAREYMDVALHGLSNPQDSPSALATPTHRTMLGTERYRDTRFGDEPMVPWGTPTVDLDSGYPATPGGGW